MSKRQRAAVRELSDFGPEIQDPNTGEVFKPIPVVVEDVAVGVRAAVKRGRRRHAWEGVQGITPGMHLAALAYQQAWEHLCDGKGMGPMPWGADMGRGLGVALFPQERAITAATVHRRGVQAMGVIASEGVVRWVVLDGRSLGSYDAARQQREGRGARELVEALNRLAVAYGVA